jgi:hypothetical protein
VVLRSESDQWCARDDLVTEMFMLNPRLLSTITAMRPVMPAKDFVDSTRFYLAVGFEPAPLAPTLTEMRLGTYSFLLQDFYVPEFANNFVMHMSVASADEWCAHIESLDLPHSFRVRAPIAPRLEPWGLRVTYLFDPSGVLWQIHSRP